VPYPEKLPEKKGIATVQVVRTFCPHFHTSVSLLHDPQRVVFPVEEGEMSIYLSYQSAIKRVKQYIYIENQHITHPELLELLIEALERGVIVVFLVPNYFGSHILYHKV